MFAGTAALLLTVAAPGQASIVGLYQIRQMEIGGGLELGKDGHFRYQLDYGAVSETAEGDWAFDGKAVRLTTRPTPKQPSFELVRDDRAPAGQIWMTVEPPGFGDGYRLDAIATDVSGAKGRVTADKDGRIDSGDHRLTAIDPLVPVYGTEAGHFPLTPDHGHRLVFRFHANDLGKAAFRGERLTLSGRDLLLNRYDTSIRFMRVRP